jgi:hypothetical protein
MRERQLTSEDEKKNSSLSRRKLRTVVTHVGSSVSAERVDEGLVWITEFVLSTFIFRRTFSASAESLSRSSVSVSEYGLVHVVTGNDKIVRYKTDIFSVEDV